MSNTTRRFTVGALFLAAAGGAWFFFGDGSAQMAPSSRALSLPEGRDDSAQLAFAPEPILDMPLLPRHERRAIVPRAPRWSHPRAAQIRAPRGRPPEAPPPPRVFSAAAVPVASAEPPAATDGVAAPTADLRVVDLP